MIAGLLRGSPGLRKSGALMTFEDEDEWAAPQTEVDLRAVCDDLLQDTYEAWAADLSTKWELRLAKRFQKAVMAYFGCRASDDA